MAEDGFVDQTTVYTKTLYNPDGTVAWQTTTAEPTQSYVGVGDPYAYLPPGVYAKPGDATGGANAANYDPESEDLLSMAVHGTEAAANYVTEGVESVAKTVVDKIPSVWDALMLPLILVVAGLGLWYLGPAIGALATRAVKKAG